MKVAINGFGRIGRAVARAIIKDDTLILTKINDLANLEMCAYLLKYDSTHKNFEFNVEVKDNYIQVHNQKIFLSQDFSDVDIVVESSGKLHSLDYKTIFTAMPKNNDMQVYLNKITNNDILKNQIFSAGSCSSNALAYILKPIDEAFRIISGNITTIHSYTSDQNLLDSKATDFARSRSATNNIIPIQTGVVKNLRFLLPNLADKLTSFSVRVPVKNVTMLDITLSLSKNVKITTLNNLLEDVIKNQYKNIVNIAQNNMVSSDFISDIHIVNIDTSLTQKSGSCYKIVAWFDNETGYANSVFNILKKLKEHNEIKNNKPVRY